MLPQWQHIIPKLHLHEGNVMVRARDHHFVCFKLKGHFGKTDALNNLCAQTEDLIVTLQQYYELWSCGLIYITSRIKLAGCNSCKLIWTDIVITG